MKVLQQMQVLRQKKIKINKLPTTILLYILAPYKDIMLTPNVGIAIVNNFIT
jgi:hypothetical protein